MNRYETAEQFWQEAEALGRAAQVSLEYLQAMGLETLDITLANPGPAGPPKVQTREKPPAAQAPATQCQACPLGHEGQGKALMGRGSPRPLIAFVGESPAIFEGEAANLLTAMIEKGLKLGSDDVYITSLLKCVPKEDTDFPAQAADLCLPQLNRELALLRPSIVLALGKWPGRLLSGRKAEHLLMLRQQTHSIAGLNQAWLRVTYGLDELLATPELKKETWKDLQKIIPVITKLRSAATSI